MFVTRHANAPAIKQVAGESCQTCAMEEQAIYESRFGPQPPLTAEAVTTLLAEAAAYLKSQGFKVFGWRNEPDALAPLHVPCQDIRGEWQGPQARFEPMLTGYPGLGVVTLELQARLLGLRGDSGQFYVRNLADVRFLLENWLPLRSAREQAQGG
jgi:hypothetical protein